MAGAGWKDFVPGEVLSAANVQDYLQDQSVMVFASAAARTSALASPSEGMVSYLKDTDTVERFDGSSWVVPFSVANGGTGATTVAGARTNLQLTSTVLATYFVQMTATQSFTTNSGVFVDLTGMSITITPKSANSKFLISSTAFLANSSAGLRGDNALRVLQGTTELTRTRVSPTVSDAAYSTFSYPLSFLDAPATTSAITYKLQATQAATSSATVYVNRRGDTNDIITAGRTYLQILEISA